MKLLLGLLLAVLSCFAFTEAQKAARCLLRHSLDGDGLTTCEANFPSWSYNADEDKCVRFTYGGCGGNANRFGSLGDCEKACKN